MPTKAVVWENGNHVIDQDPDGADLDILEPVDGVDLDHYSGRVGRKELVVNPEHKLVVPRRVGVAVVVNPGGEPAVRVDPRHRVGVHRAGDRSKVLGRYDVELQQLERVQKAGHRDR